MGRRGNTGGSVLATTWGGSPTRTSAESTLVGTPTSGPAPSGVLELYFGYDDVAASQTALQGWTLIPGSAATPHQTDEQMLFDGSIIGLSFRGNTAKTAGSAVFTAYVAGLALTPAISVPWATGQFRGFQSFAPGIYGFTAGADVGPRLTTDAAFLPITVDVAVRLYVTFAAS